MILGWALWHLCLQMSPVFEFPLQSCAWDVRLQLDSCARVEPTKIAPEIMWASELYIGFVICQIVESWSLES